MLKLNGIFHSHIGSTEVCNFASVVVSYGVVSVSRVQCVSIYIHTASPSKYGEPCNARRSNCIPYCITNHKTGDRSNVSRIRQCAKYIRALQVSGTSVQLRGERQCCHTHISVLRSPSSCILSWFPVSVGFNRFTLISGLNAVQPRAYLLRTGIRS